MQKTALNLTALISAALLPTLLPAGTAENRRAATARPARHG